jgi:hypothetical protein
MGAFYVIGSVLAGWALLVSCLGVVRKDFPGSAVAERTVALVSVALVAGAIGAAVIGALNAEHEESEDGGHETALVLPV